MDKKLYQLSIDPELHSMIVPLSDDEYKLLEEAIIKDGCDTPITIWNNTVVDGHNRYEICHKQGIPFAIEEKKFYDKEEAICWMLERQLARRNLTAYQRAELALKYKSILSSQAKKRMAMNAHPELTKDGQYGTYGRTVEKLAKMAGVSTTTMKAIEKINERADPEIKEKLRKGEISVRKAYFSLYDQGVYSPPQEYKPAQQTSQSHSQDVNIVLRSDELPLEGLNIQNASITIVHVDDGTYPQYLENLLQKVR